MHESYLAVEKVIAIITLAYFFWATL